MKHPRVSAPVLTVDYEYELEIQRTIINFATSMFRQNKVDDILWDVAQNCISKLHFEDCVIYMIDHEKKVLVQKAAYGPKSFGKLKIRNPITINIGQGIVGTVAKTGIAEIVADTAHDPRYIRDDAQRFSELAVPIVYEEQVLGVIDSEHSQKNFFNERHLQILTTIAKLCANKISRAMIDEKIHSIDLEISEMKRHVAEAKLSALRAQMSPHFVFNSLNAIQHFITSNNNEDALSYLNRFSKLIRLILQKANDNQVSIADEITMLELYMQIESMRFSDRFEYTIKVDPEINQHSMAIPSMMIQPFVEYAIHFSLMHKKEKGMLMLEIKKSASKLICTVTDNGIARSESEHLKNSHKIQHDDAIENAFKRLATLNSLSNKTAAIQINNLNDSYGQWSGTCVEISLPFEKL